MDKIIIVINGAGGVGKDTICDIVGKHYNTMNVSSIDPIKEIALNNGWNGEKDDKSRKLLSDLKKIFVDYCDLPILFLRTKITEFHSSDKEILFVHIREPEEINKFTSECSCITLLIKGGKNKKYGNSSDDNVENYHYDYCYDNNDTLEKLEKDFMNFFENTILHNYK